MLASQEFYVLLGLMTLIFLWQSRNMAVQAKTVATDLQTIKASLAEQRLERLKEAGTQEAHWTAFKVDVLERFAKISELNRHASVGQQLRDVDLRMQHLERAIIDSLGQRTALQQLPDSFTTSPRVLTPVEDKTELTTPAETGQIRKDVTAS